MDDEELKRDHRRRWLAVGAGFLLSIGLATFFSVKERFFDPWFFFMVLAPVIGIALVVAIRHLLENRFPPRS